MSSDDIVYPPDVIEVLKKLRDKPEKAKQPNCRKERSDEELYMGCRNTR